MNTKINNELSYFRLKLEIYLKEHHPEKTNETMFITTRADEALTAYCDAITQGFSHPEAESLASEVLYHGLHFSKYDMLKTILENEFEKEFPLDLPERLARILIHNKTIERIFDTYAIAEDFEGSPDYEKLYTELTGTIVILIETEKLQIVES